MIARTALGKILVFSIFFVGIATGAVLDNVYRTRVAAPADTVDTASNRGDRPNPQDRAKRDLDKMFKYLGTTPTQEEQIQKILGEMRTDFRQLREEVDQSVGPRFKALEQGSREKIRALLNDEQRRKWDEFRESHPARGERGDRGRPPHSPEKDKDRQNNK